LIIVLQHRNTVLRKASISAFLGLSLLALAVPWSAHAGAVHVSLGCELPVPVAVVPAPLPVVVAPAPVVVQRPPVVVYPVPVVVRQWRARGPSTSILYFEVLSPLKVPGFRACLRNSL
jgi:hypothetical protein